MEIVSRTAARDAGRPRYFTGQPCSKGHISERYTSTGNCRECQKSYSATYNSATKAVRYANFDQRKAELLNPAIHVPPHRHEEIYQFIDYVLATEGRPPCPRPIVAAERPPSLPPGLTKWEGIYTVHYPRVGHTQAHYIASLGGLSEFPHSEGWAFPPGAVPTAPPPPPEHLGGNKPDYL